MNPSLLLSFGTVVALAIVALLLVRPLRRSLLSAPLFATYKKVLPQMSTTEKDALEATRPSSLCSVRGLARWHRHRVLLEEIPDHVVG